MIKSKYEAKEESDDTKLGQSNGFQGASLRRRGEDGRGVVRSIFVNLEPIS